MVPRPVATECSIRREPARVREAERNQGEAPARAGTSLQQLALVRELLAKEDASPDFYAIDVIWSGAVCEDLLDLKSLFASELSADDPDVAASFTVQGKVVAVPYHTNIGVLLYRTDLLKKYGYSRPPQTWAELEKMALNIQQRQRAAGDKDFWGFVWPGADGEGLTCLALEWQASEGGGTIVESNRTVSVDNNRTTRAWERAAHWIGWISPPGVTSNEEWDINNRFEHSGEAAFSRGWTSDYFLTNPAKSPMYGRLGVTSVPAGAVTRVGTLGGFGLGIARRSKHQPQAIALVRFLVQKELELEAKRAIAQPPPETPLYQLPKILKAYSRSMPELYNQGAGVVSRPSTVTGKNYEKVSREYASAVSSVLTGQKSAALAAATLQTELEQITGFPKGLPLPGNTEAARLK